MGTLVMRLSAPLQSWGLNGRFNERTTNAYPTKSGIVGLLASSLGRRRHEDISDLAALRIGVRIDQPGTLLRDYQTAKTRKYDRSANRYVSTGDAYISNRFYLEDATFIVAIEGDDDLLVTLAKSLDHPVFPLFLGRRACSPSTRILVSVMPDKGMMEALSAVPWAGSVRVYRSGVMRDSELEDTDIRLMVMRDKLNDGTDCDLPQEQAHDFPISFSPHRRLFAWRTVVHDSVIVTNPHAINDSVATAAGKHDPVSAIEDTVKTSEP